MLGHKSNQNFSLAVFLKWRCCVRGAQNMQRPLVGPPADSPPSPPEAPTKGGVTDSLTWG